MQELRALQQEFLDECADILEGLEDLGLALEQGSLQESQAREVARALHNIKGSAGAVELPDLAQMAHELEDFYLRAQANQLAHRALGGQLLAGVDRLRDAVLQLKRDPQCTIAFDEFHAQLASAPLPAAPAARASAQTEGEVAEVHRFILRRIIKRLDGSAYLRLGAEVFQLEGDLTAIFGPAPLTNQQKLRLSLSRTPRRTAVILP